MDETTQAEYIEYLEEALKEASTRVEQLRRELHAAGIYTSELERELEARDFLESLDA